DAPVLLAQHRVVVVARGLDVALHEGERPLAIGPELLAVEDAAALPGKNVTDPDEHLRVALSLGHAWEGLWDQDSVHLLAPERLERRAHRLERDDLDVAEAEAFLLQYVAELIVERRAELGHADAPPLEVADGPDAGIPEVLLDDKGRERVTGPLPPPLRDAPGPLPRPARLCEGQVHA